MSIMDMFKQQQQPPQQQQQPQPGNMPQQEPAPSDGQVPNQPQQQQEDQNPLDQYAKLWETDPNSPNTPQSFVPLDAKQLQQVVGKVDFARGVTPEHLTAITEGGEGAITAFTDVLNSVARQVMSQSTLASNKMIEAAVSKSSQYTQEQLPNMLRQQQAASANPLFSNPAVKPVIDAVQQQLAATNPNATGTELAEMAQNFVIAMGEAFAPKPATSPTDDPVDWEAWANNS